MTELKQHQWLNYSCKTYRYRSNNRLRWRSLKQSTWYWKHTTSITVAVWWSGCKGMCRVEKVWSACQKSTKELLIVGTNFLLPFWNLLPSTSSRKDWTNIWEMWSTKTRISPPIIIKLKFKIKRWRVLTSRGIKRNAILRWYTANFVGE